MAKHVLIAEDDRKLSKLFTKVLQHEGFEISIAQDGLRAARRLEAYRPDLLILDVNLPQICGLELLAGMRDDPRFDGVPVIIVTGDFQSERDPRANLADLILFKPVHISELVNFVHRLIPQCTV